MVLHNLPQLGKASLAGFIHVILSFLRSGNARRQRRMRPHYLGLFRQSRATGEKRPSLSGEKAMGNKGISRVGVVVLVLIMALLSMILVPILLRAREWQRVATCVSNLAAIGRALHSYTASNNGYFPPAFKTEHWPPRGFTQMGHVRSAHQALAEYLEAPRWPEAWDENYLSMNMTEAELKQMTGEPNSHREFTAKKYGVLNCPEDRKRSFPAFSYGVNAYVCYNDFDTVETYTLDAYGKGRAVCYQRMDVIAEPARSIYMADAYYPPQWKWTQEDGVVEEPGGKLVYLRAGAHVTPGFISPGFPVRRVGKEITKDAGWYMDLYGLVNKDMLPSADYLGGRLDFRHTDYTCNALFLDGHVEAFHMGDEEKLIRRAGYHEVDVRRGELKNIACRGLLTGLDYDSGYSVWNRYYLVGSYDPYGRKDSRGRDLTIDGAIGGDWPRSPWGDGYCPHVLAYDEGWQRQGVLLTGRMGQAQEGKDALVVKRLSTAGGLLRLKVCNLESEIDYLERVRLGCARLFPGEELDVDIEGNPVVWQPYREMKLDSGELWAGDSAHRMTLDSNWQGDVVVLEVQNTSLFETSRGNVLSDGGISYMPGALQVQFGPGRMTEVEPVGPEFSRRVVIPVPEGATTVELGGDTRSWLVSRLWLGSRRKPEPPIKWLAPIETLGPQVNARELLLNQDGERLRLAPNIPGIVNRFRKIFHDEFDALYSDFLHPVIIVLSGSAHKDFPYMRNPVKSAVKCQSFRSADSNTVIEHRPGGHNGIVHDEFLLSHQGIGNVGILG